jgi:hypothetical protein
MIKEDMVKGDMLRDAEQPWEWELALPRGSASGQGFLMTITEMFFQPPQP